LRQSFPMTNVVESQNLQNKIFSSDIGIALPSNHNLYRLWNFDANVFSDPGIENIRCPDPKRNAPDRAHMRRMRIRAHVDLTRQRIGLKHHGVADALRALAVCEFTVQLD